MTEQAAPAGPRGVLASFFSRAQDPNWDRQRKLRAQPYQRRLDAWRRAMQAWKKSGPFGLGGFSWNKPAALPRAPAELAPYVKAVRVDGLAKAFALRQLPQVPRHLQAATLAGLGSSAQKTAMPLRAGTAALGRTAPERAAGRLPLPLRAAVALSKPVVAAAGRKVASVVTPGRLAGAAALGAGGVMLTAAHRKAKRKNEEKRKALFGLRKAAPLKAIARWAKGTKFNAAGLSEAFGRGVREIRANRFNRIPATTEAAMWTSNEKLFGVKGRRGALYANQLTRRTFNDPYSVYVRQHELGHMADRAIKPPLTGRSGVRASLRRFTPDHAQDAAAYPTEADRDAERIAEAFAIVGARHHGIKRAGEAYARQAPGLRASVRALRLSALQRGLVRKGWSPHRAGEGRSEEALTADDRLAKFFDESKVNRAEDGKFAPKGGGSKMAAGAPRARHVASIYSRGPNWEDREKPAYDPARSVRPTKDMPFGLRQAYAKYRAELDAKPPAPPKAAEEIRLKAPDLADLPANGRFKEITQKPQVPSSMTQEQYVQLARWAAERTKGLREDIITRSIGRRDPGGHKNRILIPAGVDPKDRDVRLAFNVARNLALHDVGLIGYDHRMTPETIQALQPYKDFIKHARRRMANTLREEAKPGTWAPFRREFGTPFKDGRTYRFDTRAGHQAGEPKKAFARHMHFLKGMGEGGLAKSRPLSEAERKQRIDAARASAAARSRQRQQLSGRSFEPPGRGYAPLPERHMNRDAAAAVVAEHEDLHARRQAILNRDLAPREGVFARTRPLTQRERQALGELEEQIKAVRPKAAKARVELRARDLASSQGPRWKYVGLDPAHWAHPSEMPVTPPHRVFTGRKAATPPAAAATQAVRAAARWGRAARVGGAVAGAAALAGAAYGLGRWRERRKAA